MAVEKYLAFYLENNIRKKVTIWDIANNKSLKEKTFYSYSYGNPQLVFVSESSNGRSSHFRYKSKNNYSYNNGQGESLTHMVYKEVIASVDRLTLSFYNPIDDNQETVTLFNVTSQTEYRLALDGNIYVADIYSEFERSEPEIYSKRWKNHVIIEITYTHDTEEKKYDSLKNNNYAVFEFIVKEKYALHKDNQFAHQSIANTIEKFAREGLFLICHSFPIMKVERYINSLKDEIKKLENQNLQKNKDLKYYEELNDSLVYRCSNLESEKEELEKQYNLAITKKNQDICFLMNECDKLQTELNKLKKRSLIKRIINK